VHCKKIAFAGFFVIVVDKIKRVFFSVVIKKSDHELEENF